MTPWSTAIDDVRTILSDGPSDKLRYRKKVIGIQNGTNVTFKSFEYRRITTFVGSVAPIGVYVDDVSVPIASDDLPSGEFVLSAAPTNGQTLRATYYMQWFIDSEITQFLVSAAQWVGNADDYLSITSDLQPAAKEYAAGIAYQKLVARFSENLAEIYQLYDAPDEKRFDPIKAYMNISDMKLKLALQLRDDVYTRKGMAKAPRAVTLAGTVIDVPPNR